MHCLFLAAQDGSQHVHAHQHTHARAYTHTPAEPAVTVAGEGDGVDLKALVNSLVPELKKSEQDFAAQLAQMSKADKERKCVVTAHEILHALRISAEYLLRSSAARPRDHRGNIITNAMPLHETKQLDLYKDSLFSGAEYLKLKRRVFELEERELAGEHT